MSSLRQVQRTWTHLGRQNPMWAVLTYREDWDEDEFFATGEQEAAKLFDDLTLLGLTPSGMRALDFGSGLGRLTRALATRFDEVVGVDISPPMVEKARELAADSPGITFVVNSRPDLSIFEDESFDLVYSNITLQHMPPSLSRGYMNEFVRVLRPGGVICFQLPTGVREEAGEPGRVNRAALQARGFFGRVVRLGRRHMEMHWLPEVEVEGILVQAGAELVDVSPDDGGGRRWHSARYVATKR